LVHELRGDGLHHGSEPPVLLVQLAEGRIIADQVVHRSLACCVGHQKHDEALCDAARLASRERNQRGVDREARLSRASLHLVPDDVDKELVEEPARDLRVRREEGGWARAA
jgi:hypothetical protein